MGAITSCCIFEELPCAEFPSTVHSSDASAFRRLTQSRNKEYGHKPEISKGNWGWGIGRRKQQAISQFHALRHPHQDGQNWTKRSLGFKAQQLQVPDPDSGTNKLPGNQNPYPHLFSNLLPASLAEYSRKLSSGDSCRVFTTQMSTNQPMLTLPHLLWHSWYHS